VSAAREAPVSPKSAPDVAPAEQAPQPSNSKALSANQKVAQSDATVETKANANANEKDTKELAASPSKIPTARARKRRKRTVVVRKDPHKVVVPEGGAREPPAQIAPGLAPEEVARERRDTEQWLASADGQLKMLSGRTLGAQQEETMGQVRNYMVGARSALKEGDMRRANTLALKAHLLSEDLVKH